MVGFIRSGPLYKLDTGYIQKFSDEFYMKRIVDCFLIIFVGPLVLFLYFCIYSVALILSGRPVLYWSRRVGRGNRLFNMPKFRTMRLDTPAVATHLLKDPKRYLTLIGGFLRRTSLDEIPQLWCILLGDMSFVGPRPALHNQEDLISLRTQYGVHTLTPGLTGWAQVNGRDQLSIPDKVRLDVEYLHRRSLIFDLKILWITFLRVIRQQGVSH